MKKRILSIVLALCMVLALMPQMAFADENYNGFTYTVSNGEVTITKYNGSVGAVEIPSKINEMDVTAIGEYAFKMRTSLTSITIPDSVKSIGDSAFSECTNLTSITIPNGVTSIGSSAFYACKKLTSITVPDSVTSIGSQAFYDCTSLTDIKISNSLSSIEYGTFSHCTNLTSITIPNSVTSIDWNAFSDCTNLATITIPETVTFIGENAFYRTAWLASKQAENPLVVVNGILIDGKSATGENSIPNSVTSIGDFAFSACKNLTRITIPDSVTAIGRNAFSDCTGLTSITIPNSVTSIGNSAFAYCQNLEIIFLPESLDVIHAGIQGKATKVRYRLNETNGEVTITEIGLGGDKTSVDIPETICGYTVADVAASEQSKVGAHTCKGGAATCNAKAKCALCSKEYGEQAPNNHTGSLVWEKTETEHEQKWNCCGVIEVSLENHIWSNGVCTKCNYSCSHKDTNKDHKCDICQTKLSKNTGGYIPTVQKPTIEAGEGVKVDLSSDGTVATIKVDDGYEIADVMLNGVSLGKVTEVKNLKTGDKLVVTSEKKPAEPTKEEILAVLAEQKLVARSKLVTMKSGKKAVRITWYNRNGEIMDFDGVEIFRSTKKNTGYGKKPIFTSKTGKYTNTSVKVGTRYYYRVRGFVIIDGQKYYTDWSLKAIRRVK
ncbi:MAG: leucine-rich repeat domain-containing protein [Anaerovoracaceae bacterium]